MHKRLFILAALCVALTPARAQPAPEASASLNWSYAQSPRVARIEADGLTVTITGQIVDRESESVRPRFTVERRDFPPLVLDGEEAGAWAIQSAHIGRWDRAGRPYALIVSRSGGTHCCDDVKLVLPEARRFTTIDLGRWDSRSVGLENPDIDGEGTVDFRFLDEGFLYAFASYADSVAPPRIFNVVNGVVIDVSAEPAFRELFVEAMQEARVVCLHPEDGRSPNGGCAAYVASAARAGRFDEAWAEMLGAYDRTSDWPLPSGCRTALVESQCPAGQEIEYPDYPDALRAFLIDHGYLER
jgi:hypothetical protein